MPGRRNPVDGTRRLTQAERETFEWFDHVSDNDLAAYAGKYIVQYRGEIIAVRREEAAAYSAIDRAVRQGRLPAGAEPFVYWVPPPDLVLYGPLAYYGGRFHWGRP